MIDFTGLEMTFPQLYLIDILNNVRYAVPVKRASFRNELQHRDRVKDNKGQGRTSGVQGGWEHTGDNSLPRGGYGNGAGGANRQNNSDRADLEEQDMFSTHTGGKVGDNGIGGPAGWTFATISSKQ